MAHGAYTGEEKLCFGMDLGTTMSAVSFAHLESGETPRIRLVTRWPGQEDAAGDCKVPTVVRYTASGAAVLFGAEAIENVDNLENTTLAKWFKLHMHPETMRAKSQLTPPALPRGVTLKTIYADMLAYLYKHACVFIDGSSLDAVGRGSLCQRLKNNTVVILAIPNGWEDSQQAFLREAVVAAGILPFNHARERLQFVSESEASVHFAITYADITSWLRVGTTLAVCDAGGSTVDTTVYKCTAEAPNLQLEEVTASECVQAGSAFVDQEAERFLRDKLSSSRYGTPEVMESIVREFERKTKRKFDGTNEKSVIQFGQNFDNDRPLVSAGRITLTCTEAKGLFERPIQAITTSVNSVLARSRGAEAMLLVGGFAESLYLQSVLRDRVQAQGVKLYNIDEATKKAAAEGALSWFTKQFVVARAARATYGIAVYRPYDRSQPDQLARAKQNAVFVSPEGVSSLAGFFNPLVRKNEVLQNDKSTRWPFCHEFATFPTTLAQHEVTLLCAETATPGTWCRSVGGSFLPGFRIMCTLKADLSGLQSSLRSYAAAKGRGQYWRIEYEVEVFFGQTSLCAGLVWKERGQIRKGPVSVIPNSIV